MDYEKMSVMEVIERHLSPISTSDGSVNAVGSSESRYGREVDEALNGGKERIGWVDFCRVYGGHRNGK